TAAHSRRLAEKQFITRNELERDELAFQSQASKVTIAWNDLELLINYTLQRDKIEFRQNLENAEIEVARVTAKNDAERKNSQFDIDAKQKEFEIASDRLATLNRQIENSVIYSPGEGLVVYSKVSRGRGDSEPVEEGTSIRQYQTIIILPDNSRLKCRIKVQEAMIEKVRRGMPAHISAEVRPNEVMTGRVTYVAPVADSASRWSGNDKKVYTTEVMLDGINRDESLKAGMKAAATITVDTEPSVLTVPIQAVRRDRAVNYIWKDTPEGPVAVAVEVGANNQEKVVVLKGVDEGDMIYRTPPGAQADPKFDQPEVPEPAPAPKGEATEAASPKASPRREGSSRRG
ncbi:MAG: efflux RND transporter periplasmic adaptor subunit, partial [Planctomycetota bacterium]|nr:efflux RND transporter periplasmic adaptor subunit [Planctomycetota bacterium]